MRHNRKGRFLVGLAFIACLLVLTQMGVAESGSNADSTSATEKQPPVGQWQSVDFVRTIDQFVPGKRASRGNLFLKEFQCTESGRTSLGWTCKEGWATHRDGKTRARYYLKQIDGSTYLFLPWLSGDVTIRGMKPHYYVLRRTNTKASHARMRPATSGRRGFRDLTPIDRVDSYQDVRWKDMSKLSLKNRPNVPATLTFNKRTVWPPPEAMPEGCDPKKIMADAMIPPLGIRAIHRQGITGKGVNVAIIDQPLFQDHPELAGKIAAYHDVGCGSDSSMHGPAVASLLVGARCGTAPGATVYYAAAPSWTGDSAFYGKALDWILEQNRKLKDGEKIRVVSVSAAPSGPGSPFNKNNEAWDEARDRAKAEGVLVLDCTSHHGFIGPCYYDARDPEDVARCEPGFPGLPGRFRSGKLLVPSSPRTVAEEYDKGQCSYQYCGRGGLSWSIPYCAGVFALGWQVRPDLTPEQMRECLFESAHVTTEGAKVIDPKEFIRRVRQTTK